MDADFPLDGRPHEVVHRKTQRRRRRTKDQCQPRGPVLELDQGNCARGRNDGVQVDCGHRQDARTEQFVLGNTRIRTQLCSFELGKRENTWLLISTEKLEAQLIVVCRLLAMDLGMALSAKR
jgi:hypothetical protein